MQNHKLHGERSSKTGQWVSRPGWGGHALKELHRRKKAHKAAKQARKVNRD